MYDKQRLIALVREKALKFGDFTLASGKKASFYLDGKQVTLDSQGAMLVAEGILDLLGPRLPKAVGGMAIGADPITAAVITMAGVRGWKAEVDFARGLLPTLAWYRAAGWLGGPEKMEARHHD